MDIKTSQIIEKRVDLSFLEVAVGWIWRFLFFSS